MTSEEKLKKLQELVSSDQLDALLEKAEKNALEKTRRCGETDHQFFALAPDKDGEPPVFCFIPSGHKKPAVTRTAGFWQAITSPEVVARIRELVVPAAETPKV